MYYYCAGILLKLCCTSSRCCSWGSLVLQAVTHAQAPAKHPAHVDVSIMYAAALTIMHAPWLAAWFHVALTLCSCDMIASPAAGLSIAGAYLRMMLRDSMSGMRQQMMAAIMPLHDARSKASCAPCPGKEREVTSCSAHSMGAPDDGQHNPPCHVPLSEHPCSDGSQYSLA